MGQVDFAYEAVADAVGLRLAVSIFADADHLREEIREDAEAAGLLVRQCSALASLAQGAPAALGEVIVLDCPAPAPATLATLARLDARAARSGAHLVVCTSADALEAVFACCSESQPQFLVDPRRADRIIALGQILAGPPHLRLRELSEDDRLTLLRLTEQVNTIAQRLERIDRRGGARPAGFGSVFEFDEEYQGAGGQGERLVRAARPPLPDPRLVRRIIQQRQLRARFFDGDLFADPAWDMLLDLTAARAEHQRVSVTSLCIASGVPPTTALRWIGQMSEAGLLERIEDETDRRRAFIQLTDKAADAMARYFAELDKSAAGLV